MLSHRLKSEIRVAAHIRRAEAAGAYATIARRGDGDAGAIAIKVYLGGRRAQLFVEGRDEEGEPCWRDPLDGPAEEEAVDNWLAREAKFDSDLWVVEIEDKEGRSFTD